MGLGNRLLRPHPRRSIKGNQFPSLSQHGPHTSFLVLLVRVGELKNLMDPRNRRGKQHPFSQYTWKNIVNFHTLRGNPLLVEEKIIHFYVPQDQPGRLCTALRGF